MFTLNTQEIKTKLIAKIFFNNVERDTSVIRASITIDGNEIDQSVTNIASTLKEAFCAGRAPLHNSIRKIVTKTSTHSSILAEIEATAGQSADYVINYGTRDFIVVFQSREEAVLVINKQAKKPTLIWGKTKYSETRKGGDVTYVSFKMSDAGNTLSASKEILSPRAAREYIMKQLKKLECETNRYAMRDALNEYLGQKGRAAKEEIVVPAVEPVVTEESIDLDAMLAKAVEVETIVEEVEVIEVEEVVAPDVPVRLGRNGLPLSAEDIAEIEEREAEERRALLVQQRLQINKQNNLSDEIVHEFERQHDALIKEQEIIAYQEEQAEEYRNQFGIQKSY